MSADNWSTCPKCAVVKAAKVRALDVAVAEAYGAVSAEEFDAMRATRDALRDQPAPETVREDYEFYGVEDGEFHASYAARCMADDCDFTFSFKHDEDFDLEVPA